MTDIVLEMTREVLDIKIEEKLQLEKRISHYNGLPAEAFVNDTDAMYKQSAEFAETEKALAVIQLRARLIDITGAIQGAKDQIKKIEEELDKKNE